MGLLDKMLGKITEKALGRPESGAEAFDAAKTIERAESMSDALSEAIVRAAVHATSSGGLPAARDLGTVPSRFK